MPCTFLNYFVNTSHGNRYKVLCKQQSPSWAQRVTRVIIWASPSGPISPGQASCLWLPQLQPISAATATLTCICVSGFLASPLLRASLQTHRPAPENQRAEQLAQQTPPCLLLSTLSTHPDPWQPASSHETTKGILAFQKHPEKHQPAQLLSGVPDAQVSHPAHPPSSEGRCVSRESLGPPCLHLTRGPSPHPAGFSFRISSETPFSRSLSIKRGNLSHVQRGWYLYLLLIGIQKSYTPTCLYCWPNPQTSFICCFFFSLLHQQYQERADDTSVVNMRFLLEYRLVRSGGVLLEFVKHLQRYIKTSINLEKMEKILLGVSKTI